MLSLREKEVDNSENELFDESTLTYDRPDNNNKVTLRRSVTGLWQVCSSGLSDDSKTVRKDHIRRKGQKCINSVQVEQKTFSAIQRKVSPCDHSQSDLISLPREGRRTKYNRASKNRLISQVPSSKTYIPLNLPKSTNSFDMVTTDTLKKNVEHSEDDNCIGSRTRRKNLCGQGNPSLSKSNCRLKTSNKPSVLSHEVIGCNSSANHKYRTRLKASNNS